MITAAAVAAILAFGAASCGSPTAADAPLATAPTDPVTSTDGGIRTVSPADGAALAADPPDDLVVLDVRTPEEFAEGHLDGATLVDFYDPDFADQIAELDPDRPYLLYCRSGSRSGQALDLMAGLGFADVANIDGGIQAWQGAGFAVVAP